MNGLLARTMIMAVGVDDYSDRHFRKLKGPKYDLAKMRNLFIENPKTALFNEKQFLKANIRELS